MALDLSGFTTPADDFRGLYKVGDDMKQERRYQQQLAQQQRGNRLATLKYLENYLDPSEHLTGSPLDPNVIGGFHDLLTEGAKLAGEGADAPSIQMALSGKVNRLIQYAGKAKVLAQQKKAAMDLLKGRKGIDVNKFGQEFDNRAFYETDPQTGQRKMKDIMQVDPEANYADEVLRNGDVYNNEGLQEWVKGLKQNKVVSDVRLYDKNGNLRRTKAELVSPQGFVPETDARGGHTGFVPDYDIATDDGNPIIHEFQTEKGSVKAPVRMVKDEYFSSIDPEGKAYLLQEARRYAKAHGIDPSSKQVENFAKVMAYDEIKNSGKYASTISELTDNKPSAQQIRINLTGQPYAPRGGSGGGSGKDGEVTINDVYGDIEKEVSTKSPGRGLPINEMSDQTSNVVMNIARNKLGTDATIADVYVKKDSDGKVKLYTANNSFGIKTDTPVATLTPTGVNLKTNRKDKKTTEKILNDKPEAPKYKGVPNGGF